jgi:hypothetical protein
LQNARVLPDRDTMLELLPKSKVFAEIGVLLGDFSEKILRICEPHHFVGIDIFRIHELPMLWGRPTTEVLGNRTHGAFYRDRFSDFISQGRMTVLEVDSVTAMARLPNDSLDIVYVDADHSYDAVCRDLSVIKHKIRDDGLIIMNDYTMVDVLGELGPYGVIQATNEFMLAEGWEMIFLALQEYMYCDVVLRKIAV